MANRTDPLLRNVHGTNPQFLIGQITRRRIYESPYWKEHCFGLSADSLIDKAAGLQYIGGCYGGNRKPSQFLCLLLKLLQIGPSDDIVDEYMEQTEFKYLRALGAIYLRMTGTPINIYRKIEELLTDNRKLRYRLPEGRYQFIYLDEFADELLNSPVCLGLDMPALPLRKALEESDFIDLSPRQSLMQEEFDRINAENKLDTIALPRTINESAKWSRATPY